MQFLKKNYEKILLAAVALVSLGVLASLPGLISAERHKLEGQEPNFRPKSLPPLPLEAEQALLARAQSTAILDTAATNETDKLFNPVRWQQNVQGRIFPNPAGKEIDKLEVTKISPLYFEVSLVNASPASGGEPAHYVIGLKHNGAPQQRDRTLKTVYLALNETKNGVTVLSAEGSADDTSSLKLHLHLSNPDQDVTITKDEPFRWREGYTVDMKYPPENHTFPANRRIGEPIFFAGESYKIIDIKESEVVLLQESNQKLWTKKFSLTNASTAPPSP